MASGERAFPLRLASMRERGFTAVHSSSSSSSFSSSKSAENSRTTTRGRVIFDLHRVAESTTSSPQEFPGDEAGIVAAETEGIVDGGANFDFTSGMGNVVQVAFRVGTIEVDGGRHHLFFNGFDAYRHFNGPGGAEHVAGGAFGGTDGNFAGV